MRKLRELSNTAYDLTAPNAITPERIAKMQVLKLIEKFFEGCPLSYLGGVQGMELSEFRTEE